ncbi:SubName: Full=Uncharacterized protein {ECO:0000313/EMBL:CCA67797.1} [Serendipita indica DSM 11827]|uniref:Uncharacterized protein n=1 Tax=Serendipita indica (strain DSM 11827) TaxID=1109443 RepID=G4T904_SERID|nr:SubName: Full=Uncharacterized protein {ECO:0000313/EMBL:CCA67797.1} [Serendipita indica DSM 11827]CCA67797.1 hypothetical protein PIIN_01621 [Serendipita indica DSM 11827]
MAQGQPKLTAKSAPRRQSKHAKDPKKGQRTIKPKRQSLIKAAAQKQQLSAKLTKSIERQAAVAASSGKLTIMKPSATGAHALHIKQKHRLIA